MTVFSDGSLWLTFRLDSMDFCMLSDYIESIAVPGRIERMPDSPPTVAGITSHGGKLIGVVEMREIFGRMNLAQYTEEFSTMKNLHVAWVEDLTRYVQEGGTFTKALDPHKCKFGMWYDTFHTDNMRLNRLLKRISAPHERIHKCGAEILKLRAEGGDQERVIQKKLAEAEEICNEDIVPLLNQLIDVYRSAHRGVILVVNDGVNRAGLLVDEVRTLLPCNKTQQQPLDGRMHHSPYVRGLVIDGEKLLLEVDVEQILGLKQVRAIPQDGEVN